MKNKNNNQEFLEQIAKILSYGYEKDITPLQVYVGFKVHLLTKVPFRDCVEAAHEANKQILN